MPNLKDNSLETIKLFIKHYRGLLSLVLFALILIGGCWIILKSPLTIYRDSVGLLSKLKADIKLADKQLANAESYSGQLYQISNQDRKILDMALPTKPDSASIIEHVTSLAERSGFVVSNIDIEEINGRAAAKENQTNIGKISVKLKIAGGGYEELKRFVDLTQSSVMTMDISSINFNSKNPVYDISLLLYYYLSD